MSAAPSVHRGTATRSHRGSSRPDERHGQPGGGGAVDVELTGDAAVVTPHADLDGRLADALRTALAEAVTAGRHVVIDMARVSLVHPVGLGLLVRAHRDAKHRGALLCLAAPSRFVVAVLHTMCLTTVFPVLEDRDQAVAWLARQDGPGAPRTPDEARVA